MGLGGGLNSYAYAFNNPLSYIDPEGQIPILALAGPIARTIGSLAIGMAVDQLISYLPDNECDPWLSPRNWARGVNYAISADATAKGIWSGYKVRKGWGKGLSLTVDDLILTSSKGNKTSGRSKLFERTGSIDATNKDFNALSPINIRNIDRGRVGELHDGRTIIVRRKISDGRTTLEIQDGNKYIKFRYDR